MNDKIKLVQCPNCMQIFNEHFASLSRADNKTLICAKCGTKEAMDAMKLGRGEK